MGYALPVKTRYEMNENVKENEVLDCPNHRDKICILRRLKKIKFASGLVKLLKSETDDGLSTFEQDCIRSRLTAANIITSGQNRDLEVCTKSTRIALGPD